MVFSSGGFYGVTAVQAGIQKFKAEGFYGVTAAQAGIQNFKAGGFYGVTVVQAAMSVTTAQAAVQKSEVV